MLVHVKTPTAAQPVTLFRSELYRGSYVTSEDKGDESSESNAAPHLEKFLNRIAYLVGGISSYLLTDMVIFVILKCNGQCRVGTLDIDIMVFQHTDDASHQHAVEHSTLLFTTVVDLRIYLFQPENILPQNLELVLPVAGNVSQRLLHILDNHGSDDLLIHFHILLRGQRLQPG